MGIFNKRQSLKPLEYPEVLDFVDAINHSYWLFTEYNYTQDLHDYNANLTEKEKELVKRAMLAISQIEVSVKRFWANLYNNIPKPEFDMLGVSFADSEVRHARAYSNLLEILNLNEEFEKLADVPAIQNRIDYLQKYIKHTDNKESYLTAISLFSLFIENVSLFSQFYIIKSFNKERNYFKGMDNVIAATFKEEDIHARAGAYIINLIKQEHPEIFTEEFYNKLRKACKKSFEAELGIIEWIFEKGETDFLSKGIVIEFIKNRFNKSLEMIGLQPLFEINKDILKHSYWFDIEVNSLTHTDFFNKTPTAYVKKSQSITADDIF